MNKNKINAWVEELEADRQFWQEQAAFWRAQALLMAEHLGKEINAAPPQVSPKTQVEGSRATHPPSAAVAAPRSKFDEIEV